MKESMKKSFKKLLTMTFKNYILFIAGPRNSVSKSPDVTTKK